MSSPLLKTENLSVGYNGESLIDDINLSVNAGELVAIIGRNGVGKSTLLQTIRGNIPIIKGNVYLNNVLQNELTLKTRAKLLSAVSSLNNITVNLKVEEVVALGRLPYTNAFGKLHKTDKLLISEAIHQLELDKLRNKYISQISDGERQRVSIAKALTQDTEIMVLDEPTSFLDYTNKYHILRMLRDMAKNHQKAICFSTHDIDQSMQFVDKVYLLSNGKIYVGAPEDLMMSGLINKYFDTKNIFFDQETGHIRFASEMKGEIALKADNKEFFWTCKALHRCGISAIEFEGNLPYIEVVNQSAEKTVWNLVTKQGCKSFYNIYELSQHFSINY